MGRSWTIWTIHSEEYFQFVKGQKNNNWDPELWTDLFLMQPGC